MLWQLSFFPACTHHVFLSHCREDRDWLVQPVDEGLQREGIVSWFDRHDYPHGRTSFAALRDGVLRCRHTVFLITTAMVTQPRGWAMVELAWADLLQENLREAGGALQNVILPLFFLAQDEPRTMQSVWHSVRDRGVFHRADLGDATAWAVRQIAAFVRREEAFAQDVAAWLADDRESRHRLASRQGLIKRITAQTSQAGEPWKEKSGPS